jgi:RHS repeat-associated protein
MLAGTAVERESTDPSYGIYAYTAREWDPEVDLYFYRARFYDPKVGRFISEDPVGLRGGLNRYRYVDGSPAMFTDPFGTCCNDCPKGRWYIDGGPSFGGAAIFGSTLGLGNFVCMDRPWVVRRAIVWCGIVGPIVNLDVELLGFGLDMQVQGKPQVTGVTCSDDLYAYFWKQWIFQAGMYSQTDDGDILFPSNKGVNLGGIGRGRINCVAKPI